MPSLASRAFSAYCRLVVRRARWGAEGTLARRARRVFGAPWPVPQLVALGLDVTVVRGPGHVRGEWVAPRGADPSRGALLYVHGGGYVAGAAADQRTFTAALARRSGSRVFSADYRLAPDTRFPAALDDIIEAYRWVRTQIDGPLAVIGMSAGGGLALALAMHVRDAGDPPPSCVVALSPWTDLAGTGASLRTNDGRCAMFRAANIPEFAAVYLGGADAHDPRASPRFGQFAGLPPVLFQVGSTEVLLDDARDVHDGILAAGGRSRLTVYDDAAHAWQLLPFVLPEATAALDELLGFVQDCEAAIRHVSAARIT
jgi:monoterpene epsilon-lactone hydrolase